MWQASSDRKRDRKMRAIYKRKTRIGQLVQTDTTKYYVNIKKMAGEVVVEKIEYYNHSEAREVGN